MTPPNDLNELRRLLDSGAVGPQDLANILPQNELAQLLRPDPQMPQPRYDIPDLPVNSMRTETGPMAGKTASLNFTGAQGPNMAPQATQMAPQAQQQMRVVGMGNDGIRVDLGTAPAVPVPLDYSRPAFELPGVGKGYYGKDGNAYVNNPDGSKTKVLLGYDRKASEAANDRELMRQGKQADIAQTQAQTAQIGAPNFQLTPTGDVFNPKTGQIQATAVQPGMDERKKKTAAYEQGLKELAKDDTAVASAAQMETAYKEWSELNSRVTTGRVAGYMPAVGDPDRQRLKQLESFLAINNFKPGQGQISNFERGLIKGAGPSTLNDNETNQDIVKIGLGAVQNMKDRANFREQYLQAKGNLLGSDLAWQKYLDDNPRYIRDEATKRIVDNPNRSDWQQYFSGGQQSQSQAAPPVSGRKLGEIYDTPKGKLRWVGNGWAKP